MLAHKKPDHRPGLIGNFKRFFMRGLAALLPTLVTIAILIWAYELVNSRFGRYLTDGFVSAMAAIAVPEKATIDDAMLDAADADARAFGRATDEFAEENGNSTGRFITREEKQIKYWRGTDRTAPELRRLRTAPELRRLVRRLRADRYHDGPLGIALSLTGFIVAIMLVWVVGVALASFVGRRTWPRIEAFVTQLPLIKAIYPHVKQVTDFVLSERQLERVSDVVAVQYPRIGIWSVGLVTGNGMADIESRAGAPMISIFIPSSPTPFTGYVITVPRAEVIALPISIDDALRFTVSGGVIKPPSQVVPEKAKGSDEARDPPIEAGSSPEQSLPPPASGRPPERL